MASKGVVNSEVALSQVFQPVRAKPTFCGDVAVTTTPALLVSDSANTGGYGSRRFVIENLDATNDLCLFLLDAGESFTGKLPAASKRVRPNRSFEITISNSQRLACCSSAGSLTANVFVSDVG